MTNNIPNPTQEKSTLATGNYTIEVSDGPSMIYKFDKEGNKIWIASASDPDIAMTIIEGLILVEYKRFYYPDSNPTVNMESSPASPPFIKRDEK